MTKRLTVQTVHAKLITPYTDMTVNFYPLGRFCCLYSFVYISGQQLESNVTLRVERSIAGSTAALSILVLALTYG